MEVMLILEYYAHVNNYSVNLHMPNSLKDSSDVHKSPLILHDAKDITLAQYDPITSDVITAHIIKDYRHKVYSLTLLPQVTIMFDAVLEGLGYFNEDVPASS